MLGMVPPATAGRFLAAEMRRNPDVLVRFIAIVKSERQKKMRKDYKAETDRMLKRAAGKKGYIARNSKLLDFSRPMKDAKDSEKIYDYVEAARIYAEVYEAVVMNMGVRYGNSGLFSRQVSKCIEKMGKCAKEARSTSERRSILSRMTSLWIDDQHYNSHDFRKALVHGISDSDDAGYVSSMIDSRRRGGDRTTDRHDIEWFMDDVRKKVGRISRKGMRQGGRGG